MRAIAHTWERNAGTTGFRGQPLLSIVAYTPLNHPVHSVRHGAIR